MNLDTLKNEKGQKIIYLNTRSLYNNISELQLEFSNCNLISLCFCETWLSSKINSKLIDISGYIPFRLDRKIQMKGGGLLIYIRNDLEADFLKSELDVSNQNIELMNVIIKRKFQHWLCVSVVYIPPKANLELALEYLDKVSNYIEDLGYEWILGGDFNVDLNFGNNTKPNRLLRNFASSHTLTQLINKPTRKCKTKNSIIDHIYSNSTHNIKDSGVIDYGLSDHDLIYVNLKKNLEKKPKTSFSYRSLKNYCIEFLEIIIDETDWTGFYSEQNPEIAWQKLLGIYHYCLDAIAPMRNITNVRDASDWTNSELLELIRSRDRLKEKIHQNPIVDEKLLTEFKQKRNQVKRDVINAKINYTRTKIYNTEDNPKKYWAELNKIFPTGKGSKSSKQDHQNISLHDKLGNEIDSKDVADYINKFFINIGPELSSNIKSCNSDYLANLSQTNESLEDFRSTTDNEVLEFVKEYF